MAESVDEFAHTNPAFCLSCVRWTCQGYQQQRRERKDALQGFLWPWGILCLALLAPESVRSELPRNANGKLSLLFHEHPRWRLGLPETLRFWSAPFWLAVRLGIGTGTLSMQGSRLYAEGNVDNPVRLSDLDLKKRAIVFGKVLAKEADDNAISLILGLAVVP